MRESWNWLPSSRGHELSWSENIWWYAIYKTWNLSKHPGRFEDPNDYKGVHLTSEKCKFREWTWHILAAQVRTLWNWARNIWLWIKSCAKSHTFSSKLAQKPSILLNRWRLWNEIWNFPKSWNLQDSITAMTLDDGKRWALPQLLELALAPDFPHRAFCTFFNIRAKLTSVKSNYDHT